MFPNDNHGMVAKQLAVLLQPTKNDQNPTSRNQKLPKKKRTRRQTPKAPNRLHHGSLFLPHTQLPFSSAPLLPQVLQQLRTAASPAFAIEGGGLDPRQAPGARNSLSLLWPSVRFEEENARGVGGFLLGTIWDLLGILFGLFISCLLFRGLGLP